MVQCTLNDLANDVIQHRELFSATPCRHGLDFFCKISMYGYHPLITGVLGPFTRGVEGAAKRTETLPP